MENHIARAISIILHPLLIPTYALIALLNMRFIFILHLGLDAKLYVLGVTFLFTFILPIGSVYALYRLGFANSILLETKRERTFPMILTGISFIALFYLFRKLHIPQIFLYFIYGAIISVIAGMVINFFWKISLHMIAWGALTASLIGLSIRMTIDILWIVALAILLSGLVGFARLRLDAHTPAQVYAGFLTGLCLILFVTFAF